MTTVQYNGIQIKSETNVIIELDVLAGASISDTCKEACRLAKACKRNVEFRFNDIYMVARPTSSPHDMCEIYNLKLEARNKPF